MGRRKPTVEKVQRWAEKARDAWLDEHGSEQAVRDAVRDLLDDNLRAIVLNLLGITKAWPDEEWSVDHCNGRAGESAVGDFLREKAGAELRRWLEEQAGALPKLPSAAAKSIREEYREMLQREVHHALYGLAQQNANAEVKRILAGVTGLGDEALPAKVIQERPRW